jgi:hypothetical protein
MERSFIQGRIDATKLQIVAYEDAVLALADGGIESYTLDTGQSRQMVTKLNLKVLTTAIDSLYNRLATLTARLSGGATIGVPGW